MEANYLIIVVTFIVLYLRNPQYMFHYLQTTQNKNIIFKIDLFLLEMLEQKTARVKKNTQIPIHILKKIKQYQDMKKLHPSFLLKLEKYQKRQKPLHKYFDNFQ